LSNSWQCAELGATSSGTLSGTVSFGQCCSIGEWISFSGYTVVGLDTTRWCNDDYCEFEVVGVSDHTVCSLTGNADLVSFLQTSSGVDVYADYIRIDWITLFGMPVDDAHVNDPLSVQIICGQGVVAAG
jgi:hypothetical protein